VKRRNHILHDCPTGLQGYILENTSAPFVGRRIMVDIIWEKKDYKGEEDRGEI
jgi:hypothetical protein